MFAPSLSLAPVAPVDFARSDPARSTKLILAKVLLLSSVESFWWTCARRGTKTTAIVQPIVADRSSSVARGEHLSATHGCKRVRSIPNLQMNPERWLQFP